MPPPEGGETAWVVVGDESALLKAAAEGSGWGLAAACGFVVSGSGLASTADGREGTPVLGGAIPPQPARRTPTATVPAVTLNRV